MINASLPLMFCGLGVALTFKMNLNNIGAEGQYAMGAIFGGAFVLYGPEIRGIGGGIILAVMCFLGGAFWALLCAIPKAYWNVNESITTLMLNYIALIILSYLVLGPWKMPGQNVGQTKRIPVGLEIPEINGISAGIILGIVAAVVIFLAYKYTTDGYQLSVIRSSQNSARYAGINIKRNIILALVISGGLAGLAGYVQYAGVSHRIMEQMPNTQPRMVPARGPSKIAPRMTGIWVVVALMMGSWIMPRGVLASRTTMAAIMATPTIQWVSCLRVFIFNYLLLPLLHSEDAAHNFREGQGVSLACPSLPV